MNRMTRQILLSYEEPWYIAKDIITGVVSQGKSIGGAKQNLKEALELYFEDMPEDMEQDTSEYLLGTLEVI